MNYKRICKICGKEFISRGHNAVYCSHECSVSNRSYGEERVCLECGKVFIIRKECIHYCSLECRYGKHKKRLARIREAKARDVELTLGLRFKVFTRDKFKCVYCGRSPKEDGVKLHLDRVFPGLDGGKYLKSNCVTACSDCNIGKGSKIYKEVFDLTKSPYGE